MTKRKLLYILTATVALLLVACNRQRNEADRTHLNKLDSLLAVQPEAAADSLKTFSNRKLSRFNSGYYQLLEVIVLDKNYYNFTSDSLISTAEKKLSRYKRKEPGTYARSLMYLGLVRYRMGVTDSTAYQPLKEALKHFVGMTSPGILSEYLCNYYLGEIHNRNNNLLLSNKYYFKSLQIAERLNNADYLFYVHRALFWNYVKLDKLNEAKKYLDILNSLNGLNSNQLSERHNDNAQYYYSTGNYFKPLEFDLKLYKQSTNKNDSINLLSTAYRLVDDYEKINKLDSALQYALETIRYIKDTTKTYNYLYYLRVAEISEQTPDFKTSMKHYKQAYHLYNNVGKRSLDTQIFELEKKYNLTEAENNALKFKNRTILFGAISLVLLLVLTIVLIIWRQRKIKIERQRLLIEKDNKILQHEKIQAERTLLEKDLIIPLYTQISGRNLKMKSFLEELIKENSIADKPTLLRKIKTEYKLYTENLNVSDGDFITNEQFYFFSGLTFEQCKVLSNKEKMLLVFIAIKLDNQQIAVLLNTTYDSVRAYRSRLKKKMTDNMIPFEE